jgi:hypothetical protein
MKINIQELKSMVRNLIEESVDKSNSVPITEAEVETVNAEAQEEIEKQIKASIEKYNMGEISLDRKDSIGYETEDGRFVISILSPLSEGNEAPLKGTVTEFTFRQIADTDDELDVQDFFADTELTGASILQLVTEVKDFTNDAGKSFEEFNETIKSIINDVDNSIITIFDNDSGNDAFVDITSTENMNTEIIKFIETNKQGKN